jgi:hypothetical protein
VGGLKREQIYYISSLRFELANLIWLSQSVQGFAHLAAVKDAKQNGFCTVWALTKVGRR